MQDAEIEKVRDVALVTVSEAFGLAKFEEKLAAWKDEAEALVVTDPSQSKEIARAHVLRMEMRKFRTDAGKVKDALKGGIIERGREIDKAYRKVTDATLPLEAHLQEQEDVVRRIEEKRVADLKRAREYMVREYVDDPTRYGVETMTADAFDKFLAGAKADKAAREAEAAEAEQKREADAAAALKKKADDEKEAARLRKEAAKATADAAAARAEAKRLQDEADARDAADRKKKQDEADEARRQRSAKAEAKKSGLLERHGCTAANAGTWRLERVTEKGRTYDVIFIEAERVEIED